MSHHLLVQMAYHLIVGKKNLTEFASYTFISEFKFQTNPGLP